MGKSDGVPLASGGGCPLTKAPDSVAERFLDPRAGEKGGAGETEYPGEGNANESDASGEREEMGTPFNRNGLAYETSGLVRRPRTETPVVGRRREFRDKTNNRTPDACGKK